MEDNLSAQAAEYKTLLMERKWYVTRLTMNRPEFLNALNLELCGELLDAITKCALDKETRVVVLTGSGKAFSAGGDIQDMNRFSQCDPADSPGKIIDQMVSVVNQLLIALSKLKKPTIGAINGVCSGGGAGIAQACDILIASENAKIHVPNVFIGLAVDGGNSYFLTRKIGRHRAAELIFTGEAVNAAEAFRLGIFNRIVRSEDVVSEAEKLARRLAMGSICDANMTN